MSEERKVPGQSTRVYAMDHAVSIVNANSFKYPGTVAVEIATHIADYITNGPVSSSDKEQN